MLESTLHCLWDMVLWIVTHMTTWRFLAAVILLTEISLLSLRFTQGGYGTDCRLCLSVWCLQSPHWIYVSGTRVGWNRYYLVVMNQQWNGTPQQGRTCPNFYNATLALNNESQLEAKQRQRMEPTIDLQAGDLDRQSSGHVAHCSAPLLLPLISFFIVKTYYSYTSLYHNRYTRILSHSVSTVSFYSVADVCNLQWDKSHSCPSELVSWEVGLLGSASAA